MRSALCPLPAATAWMPAAALWGRPGVRWNVRSVPWKTRLSMRSSAPEDPDLPQKKLQTENLSSKVQWFQCLVALNLDQQDAFAWAQISTNRIMSTVTVYLHHLSIHSLLPEWSISKHSLCNRFCFFFYISGFPKVACLTHLAIIKC